MRATRNCPTKSMRGLASLRPRSSGLEAKRLAYDPADIARCGAFVILNHDGTVRIERGFVRAEDEQPEPEPQHESGEGDGHTIDEDGGSRPEP